MFPLAEELSPTPDVEFALSCFAELDGVLLFDSASFHPSLGRYAFLTAEPFRWFKLSEVSYGHDPFASIRGMLSRYMTMRDVSLPPFQGGVAGLMGYDLGRAWEKLPQPPSDGFQDPLLTVGLYDWTLAWDLLEQRAWIIAQGFPAENVAQRLGNARSRVAWVRKRLEGLYVRSTASASPPQKNITGPRYPVPDLEGVLSSVTRDSYLQAVQKVIDYVRAGDVFQANISQRLLIPQQSNPLDLYWRLRRTNPAPFSAYFSTDEWTILSSSPERFVAVDDAGFVETRPIKGTRRRSPQAEEDAGLREELAASEKDRAENVMIVDLLRNDFSKVCQPSSIEVPELCSLESYATVHHLVSSVTGTLEPGKTAWDLFAAAFPGGSVTGAPKIRAMEIITELEPVARGPYCGSLFYVGFDGTCDSNILIRTMIIEGGWVRFNVGGGVTARSRPDAEYTETLDKAVGMLKSLEPGHDREHMPDDSVDR